MKSSRGYSNCGVEACKTTGIKGEEGGCIICTRTPDGEVLEAIRTRGFKHTELPQKHHGVLDIVWTMCHLVIYTE